MKFPGEIPDKPLFKLKEVAEFLDVPLGTILTWMNLGQLEGVKLPGRAVRIRREELQRFLQERASKNET